MDRRDFIKTLASCSLTAISRSVLPYSAGSANDVYDLTQWTTRRDQLSNNWNAGISKIVNEHGSNVTIYIPRGTYIQNNVPWDFSFSGLTVIGEGSATILKGAKRYSRFAKTVVKNNSGRYKGWEIHKPWGFTSAEKGNDYIELNEKPDNISAGNIIFVCSGASRFDPDYGEYNIVTSVSGRRLQLHYRLSRTYSLPIAPYFFTTTTDFTVPSIGESTSVSISPIKESSKDFLYNHRSRPFLSVGNDLLKVISVDASRLTLLNTGKTGNSPPDTIIPKGTKVTKAVCVYKCARTPRNITLQNFHIEDDNHTRALDAGNSVGIRIRNISISGAYDRGNHYPQVTDSGRDILFEACSFINTTGILVGHPVSRACGDIIYRKCIFTNVAVGAGEFSHGAVFNDNTLTYNIKNTRGMKYIVSLGKTTRQINFTNNNISAYGIDHVFGTGDMSNWISDSGIDNTDMHIVSGNKITGKYKSLCTRGAIKNARIPVCT